MNRYFKNVMYIARCKKKIYISIKLTLNAGWLLKTYELIIFFGCGNYVSCFEVNTHVFLLNGRYCFEMPSIIITMLFTFIIILDY